MNYYTKRSILLSIYISTGNIVKRTVYAYWPFRKFLGNLEISLEKIWRP